ncbi:MAG TPA: TonB-dependent receptor, partial [Bryobacteraceae bacterium]|nr:TonB-dependent receptor [Bryobacteraceae bacterium]
MCPLKTLFLFILLASPALIGNDNNLAGRVVDESGTPLADVRIMLRRVDSTAGVSTVSDTGGRFQIQTGPGDYVVEAVREGFYTIRDRPIEVTGTSEDLEIVLPRLQQTSESINVSGSAASVDSQDTTRERHLTGRQIVDIPYATSRDFRNALRVMPGVLHMPGGRLSFDGGMENQVLYTLNGFNIGDPVTGQFTTRLPVESVRSVDYASGRYSPEFGKGSSGVLAMQTTNGDDNFRFSATNFVPGIETQKGLHIGTWSPRFNVSGPIHRGRAWFSESIDGEYSVAVVPDLPRGQDRMTRLRGSSVFHGQVNITPSQILGFDFVAGYENAPRTGISALDPISTSVDRGSRQYFASLKHQMYFTRGIVLDVGYAGTAIRSYERPQGDGMYVITPEGRNGNYFLNATRRSRRDQVLASVLAPSFEAAGSHQIKTGIDIDAVHYTQQAARTGYEYYDHAGRLTRRTTFGGPGSLSIGNLQMSSYVVDVWRIRPTLTVEAGIRQDWDELVRRFLLSPRVSASYELFANRNTRIAGGYAVVRDASTLTMFAQALDQYSSTVTFDVNGQPVGPPALTLFETEGRHQAPRYRNLSFGLEHRFTPQLRLTFSALRRRGDNGLTYTAMGRDGAANILKLTNLRRDSYDSVALTMHHTFGKDYSWMVNYTHSRALSNSVVDLNIDQLSRVMDNFGPLPWDAPHRLLSWGYLPAWSPNWALAYLLDVRTGFPFSVVRETGEIVGPVNSRRFPTNFELNVHLERKFRLGRYRFAVRGGLNNVTNALNATGLN